MLQQIVQHVRSDNTTRTITIDDEAVRKTGDDKPSGSKSKETNNTIICPICKKGTIIRGKTAYGCSAYKEGCTFRLPYETYGENLNNTELNKLIQLG